MIHSYQKPLKGESVGVVFGSFAPLHQGHLDLIMRAKKENDGGAIVIVCGLDGDKGEGDYDRVRLAPTCIYYAGHFRPAFL